MALTPKDLTASSIVTSSAIPQRLNRLEAQGLVRRSPKAADGRGKEVALTEQAGRCSTAPCWPSSIPSRN